MTDPTDPGGMWHGDRAPDEPVTLAEVLTARLDEAETKARAAAQGPWRVKTNASDPYWNGRNWEFGESVSARHHVCTHWRLSGPDLHISTSARHQVADMEHIALHDPSRVLREVEAGRKLLARWHEADRRRSGSAEDEARAWLLDGLLADRAAVWSDHQDYPRLP